MEPQPSDDLDSLFSPMQHTNCFQAEEYSAGQEMPYVPGLILHADEDPSSYINMSGLEVDPGVEGSNFQFDSLPQENLRPEVSSNPLLSFCSTAKSRRSFLNSYLRTFRKSLKQHSTQSYPVRGMHRMVSRTQENIWKQLRKLYEEEIHSEDRLLWRETTHEELRNHREQMMNRFFSRSCFKRYHFLFCEMVFAAQPSELCDKTQLICCQRNIHERACEDQWRNLKQYLQIGLLEEVGVPISSEDLSDCEAFHSVAFS